MKLVQFPCYCATLRQAARSATALYQAAMGSSGLQITQYTLLQAIADIPTLTTTELSAAVGMDQTTATRMLALIRRRGLIAAIGGDDRREKRWSPTPVGSRLLKKLTPEWERAQREFEALIGASAAKSLKAATYRAACKLGDHAAGDAG